MAESPSIPASEPSKSDIVNQIADALSKRRQLRGLTLEQVTQTLKIRIPFLKALESGDWNQLPGDVYTRGFLKRYAQYLGLDAETLLKPYFEYETQTKKRSPDSGPQSKDGENMKNLSLWGGLILLGLIGLFKLIHVGPLPSKESSGSAAEKQAPQAPSPTAESVSKPSPDPNHLLEIFSPFQLWLRVEAKDRTFEGFIPQGTTWTWKAEGTFQVRLGHTRQVSLYFDGRAVPISENQRRIQLPFNPSKNPE